MAHNLTCLICFKPSTSNSEDNKTLKKFLKLFERYLNVCKESESNQLVERFVNEKVLGVCENCAKIVESFCTLFNVLETTKLQLNLKVWELEKIFEGNLQSQIHDDLFIWGIDTDEKEILLDWKRKLARECNRKRLKSLPRLQLPKELEQPSRTISPGSASSLEAAISETRSKPQTCQLCSKNFFTASLLSWHYRKEHDNIPGKCNNCGKVFPRLNDLTRHHLARVCYPKEEKKRLERLFPCDVCGKKFTYNRSLSEHRRRRHEGLRFKCGYCPETRMWRGEMSNHIKTSHINPETETPLPYKVKMVKIGAVETEVESKSSSKRYSCNICHVRFATRSGVIQHKRSRHEKVRHKCPFCPAHFSRKRNVRLHTERVHHRQVDIREIQSGIDNGEDSETAMDLEDINQAQFSSQPEIKVFSTPTVTLPSSRIKKSPKLEDNAAKLPCDICGKLFRDKYKVKAHKQQIHEGIKYKCGYCEILLIHKSDVNRHIKNRHGPLPVKCQTIKGPVPSYVDDLSKKAFSCNMCSKSFTRKNYLNQHKKIEHEGLRYKCEYCNLTVTTPRSVRKHSLSVHKDPSTGNPLPVKYTVLKKPLGNKKPPRSNKISATVGEDEDLQDSLNETPDVKVFSAPTVSLTSSRVENSKPQNSKTEENTKGFPCEVCGKLFRERKNLNVHKRNIHEGVKFKCGYCRAICTDKVDIRKHLNTSHSSFPVKFHVVKPSKLPSRLGNLSKKKFPCDLCNKTFIRRTHLQEHKSGVHEGVRFKCDYCKFTTARARNFPNHNLVSHLDPSTGSPLPCKYTVLKKPEANLTGNNGETSQEPVSKAFLKFDTSINAEGEEWDEVKIPVSSEEEPL